MDKEATTQQQIQLVADRVRKAAAVYLEADISPGVITAAIMTVGYEIMKAQGMSEMQVSNELYRLVDGVRDKAFNLN